MARIAHLSDIHFGANDPNIVAATIDWLKEKKPDLVIISGDLTQRARVAQFQDAANYLQALRQNELRLLVIPGNHDIPLYDVYFLGLDVNREILHDRINKRVDIMFENGLVKEVEDLFTNPETWEYTSFQGIGYKEFKDYFLKEKSIDEVKTAIKTHSRQYAKRQYTWFKNQMPVHWFEAQNRDEIYSAVKEWLMDEDK